MDKLRKHDVQARRRSEHRRGMTGLERLLSGGPSPNGILCVHCQGKGLEPQHYDETAGWSDPNATCPTCEGTGRIYTVEQYLSTLPVDWHQDSSLERWFPLTAEELEGLKRENARLTRLTAAIPVLVGLIERCALECAECEGTGRHLKEQPSTDGDQEDCPECADLRSALALVSRAAE